MKSLENLVLLDSKIKISVMDLPVRSVAAKLTTGTVLISPGSRLTVEQLRGLGRVDDLVANNGLHNAGMPQTREVFPQARAWGVPTFDYPNILTAEHWPHPELPMVQLDGIPKLNEVVFIHKKSRTLICADLCFNLLHADGFGSWLILKMFGTHRRFAVSRLFARAIKDREAFQKSLAVLFRHDFDNILMGHGDPVIGGGRELLLKALAERGLTP